MSKNIDPAVQERASELHALAYQLYNVQFEASPTRQRLEKTVAKLESLADQEIDKVSERQPVACCAGCWFCCTQRVQASVPEILRVATYIQENWTPDQIGELMTRIESYRSKLAARETNSAIRTFRQVCPLLLDQKCSVWSARPLVCRGYGSFNASDCEARMKNPDNEPPIDAAWNQRYLADALQAGITDALASARRGPQECDLILGLHIALTVPDAGERFLRGDDVFSAAQMK